MGRDETQWATTPSPSHTSRRRNRGPKRDGGFPSCGTWRSGLDTNGAKLKRAIRGAARIKGLLSVGTRSSPSLLHKPHRPAHLRDDDKVEGVRQHLNDGGLRGRRCLPHGDRDGAIVGDDVGDLDGVTARRFASHERRQHHLAAEIHWRQFGRRLHALMHPPPNRLSLATHLGDSPLPLLG